MENKLCNSLLAIADGGRPHYDVQTAQRVAAMEIPCFACAPELLPQLLERALKGEDLTVFRQGSAPKAARNGSRN